MGYEFRLLSKVGYWRYQVGEKSFQRSAESFLRTGLALFLIGTIALSVSGNAAYQFLTNITGTSKRVVALILIIAILTGMPTPASVGAVLACFGNERSIQYVPAEYDKGLDALKPLDPVEVILSWPLDRTNGTTT